MYIYIYIYIYLFIYLFIYLLLISTFPNLVILVVKFYSAVNTIEFGQECFKCFNIYSQSDFIFLAKSN